MEEPHTPVPSKSEQKKKTNKPNKICYFAAVFACLGIIGGSGWYLLSHPSKTTSSSVQNNVEPAPALEPIPASKLALKGNQLSDFDLAFLHLENKTDNVIYSPLSIKYALAMLQDGANGTSKDQITAVIGDYTPKAYLNSANRSLANAIFVRDGFKDQVLPSYIDTLDTKYHASVVFDPFASAAPINNWVSNKTLGIIDQLVKDSDVDKLDFMLINALAIDMKWNNQLQCAANSNESGVPCKFYNGRYSHENYSWFVPMEFTKITFNKTQSDVESATIGTSVNRYDVIKELGEDKIRETVEAEYQKWVTKQKTEYPNLEIEYSATADEYYTNTYSNETTGSVYDGLNQYIKEIGENYGKLANSTDFYFLDTDTEKVFAKDLQEYDGSTLQYVGIMPKSSTLNAYLNQHTAEDFANLIANLKDASDINNYKDGVVTKITGDIPFFKFSYDMESFKSNLEQLGITDVFQQTKADLTNMVAEKGEYIEAALHKADIEFSNDGIKAAAATAFGGMGAAAPWDYKFDIPVEEIDLTFDQPFVFLIRDKSTGEIWFVGTVYNPSAN